MTKSEIVRLMALEFNMLDSEGQILDIDTLHFTHTPKSMKRHFESIADVLQVDMKLQFLLGEKSGMEGAVEIVNDTFGSDN